MIYITFNDSPSGIYYSQVTSVCDFLNREFQEKIYLVAFVSIRCYCNDRKKIKSQFSNAIVLPLFPKIRFWKMNILTLFFVVLFLRKDKVWARGPFAANLAIMIKKIGLVKKIVFDARGAYQAELTEYNVVNDKDIVADIESIERRALYESDAQLAVSAKLKEWWKTKYKFTSDKSVVIPCTLNSYFLANFPKEEEIDILRKKNGYMESDIVFIYSGSSAGWQSFDMVHDYLLELFSKSEEYKLIFMSDRIPKYLEFFRKFGNRIKTKWLNPHEVKDILLCGDYGLLIREASITNYVSSPVKFAEYLSCGLKVVISEGIGDFTFFVKENECGIVLSEKMIIQRLSYHKKKMIHELAINHFSKKTAENKIAYNQLLTYIN